MVPSLQKIQCCACSLLIGRYGGELLVVQLHCQHSISLVDVAALYEFRDDQQHALPIPNDAACDQSVWGLSFYSQDHTASLQLDAPTRPVSISMKNKI